MMQLALSRRRCLLKIATNYAGFKLERNVFADHSWRVFIGRVCDAFFSRIGKGGSFGASRALAKRSSR
jgi:hypothetical protein